ncbi:ATP-binding protein [Streptomyces sp. NPDC057193]|uniref:ATP-binding protein n=1 Tax=Streptomyces sp. NPDC057193 TaxID=3346043 RepID=UPI0036447590
MSIQQAFPPVGPAQRCACADRAAAIGCVMAAETSSVPVLRRLACRVVQQWHLPESVEEAVGLIVTELASNAVRHSGSEDVALNIVSMGDQLLIHVQDFGRWQASDACEPSEEACSGRGLDLVAAFAAHCEIRSSSEGTRVTAELLLPEPIQPGCEICG